MPLTSQQQQAVAQFVAGNAEQQKILAEQFNGDAEAYANWFANWWQGNYTPELLAQGPGDAALLTALDYELFSNEENVSVPLEQALLDQALPRLIEDVTNDENRAEMATAQQAIAQGDFDLARQIIARATSGQQLQTELGTADAGAASKRAALDDALAKLTAAQAPLADARLAEAEGAVTGVNLGLERTLDQLDADRAQQGFVGGSTSDINAATRATVDARQRAANLVGGARVANATDTRDIGGFGANQGYSIASSLADQRTGLTNADYARSLSAALSLPQLQNQYIGTVQNIDDQRNAGLLRTQRALDWWATPTAAPVAGYTPVSASNSGNDIAGLGANLTGAALAIGNANSWWQTPKAADYSGANARLNPANFDVGPQVYGTYGDAY